MENCDHKVRKLSIDTFCSRAIRPLSYRYLRNRPPATKPTEWASRLTGKWSNRWLRHGKWFLKSLKLEKIGDCGWGDGSGFHSIRPFELVDAGTDNTHESKHNFPTWTRRDRCRARLFSETKLPTRQTFADMKLIISYWESMHFPQCLDKIWNGYRV